MAKEKKKTKKAVTKKKQAKYYEAVGRRKTAVARIRLWTRGSKDFLINEGPLEKYFSTHALQHTALACLREIKAQDKYKISALVKGGGIPAQAEAVRHGTARALIKLNPKFRAPLKKAGFLTRDSRMKERKKFGLKRARRAPQWQKR